MHAGLLLLVAFCLNTQRVVFNCLQENAKTKHPQLLYESKLYRLLQGGSNNSSLDSLFLIIYINMTIVSHEPLPIWQLVFQMSSGLVLKASTMCWWLIYLALVLKTCSISVAGNFLSSPSSCLLIKWYHLPLSLVLTLVQWLTRFLYYSDNPCWVFPFKIFPSPRSQARQFPHGFRKTCKPGFLFTYIYVLFLFSFLLYKLLIIRILTPFVSKGVHHWLWSC